MHACTTIYHSIGWPKYYKCIKMTTLNECENQYSEQLISLKCFVPSLVEIGPVVLEKKLKMLKVNRRTDRQTDRRMDRQRMDNSSSQKLTWAFSSGELKTKLIPFLEQTMVGSFLEFSWAFNDSDSVWKVQNEEKIYKQFVICYNQNLRNSCTTHAWTSMYHSLGWPKV